MSNCRVTNKANKCSSVDSTTSTPTKTYDPFSTCFPLGFRLIYDGEGIRIEGQQLVPAGEYDIIVIGEDGCIEDLRKADVPEYTPGPCAPAANPCDGSGSENIPIAPGTCNLIGTDAAGRLTAFFVYQEGSSNVHMTGCGTEADPFILTVDAPEAGTYYLNSATPDVLPLTGTGSLADPRIIAHRTSALGSGTYAGFTIDEYGHVTAYEAQTTGYITELIEGAGVVITRTAGSPVATIGLETVLQNGGTWLLGGFDVSFDLYGRMTGIDQAIGLAGGIYDPYDYTFGINDYGSIYSITPTVHTERSNWSTYFEGERETNVMVIDTRLAGSLRISYVGDLGSYTSTTTTGFVNLPSAYQVRVDNLIQPAKARIVDGHIVEIQCLAYQTYQPGSHRIEINGPTSTEGDPVFSDTAYMDAWLVSIGTS